ncbi:MAG: AAA family ATPase [Candidatus Aenigmarchaeota archaeon]|nr:AAA family ATPase [Candidatus Aenigmarchaeota archaeon]
MKKIIAVVGMPGSGKSEAVKIFEEQGFKRIYFGEPVFERMKKEGLEINENNEKMIREKMREEGGMGVMAKLSISKIESLLKVGDVVIESMYSWEEYKILKEKYGDKFKVLLIYASPSTRYTRLGKREERSLTSEESEKRDYAQIEHLNTGGPIAMADFTIVNEDSLGELKEKAEKIINKINSRRYI